ncbi:hypothetical protein D9611_010312 [Ephemerocybe angulata]|uniref:F-box domain-containing protein n=1 Tax=Ephemerocybe angulata TaxID=980116 RepID=A0A8H5BB84_9AGAR|nr:hypothetical protein D9611_010312 [Tulosesus angulatus]
MLDFPPEILAEAFKIGVMTWGISFMPPVCLVSRGWYDVVTNTPHLWGIIEVTSKSSPRLLLNQISRAKATPLTVYISRGVDNIRPFHPVLNRLFELSSNWVSATLPPEVLARCRWNDLRYTLQELVINDRIQCTNPFASWAQEGAEFKALRLFSTASMDMSDLFLSSTIHHVKIIQGRITAVAPAATLTHLRKVPNVRTLKIRELKQTSTIPDQRLVITMNQLTTLELVRVDLPSLLLSSIICPALESLTIGPCPKRYLPEDTLSSFLSQWCDPKHIPIRLHTLKLEQCVRPSDVTYLIRFLARLPNLVRLSLIDDDIEASEVSTDEDNFLRALSSPQGARSAGGGWLCPSLMTLHIEADTAPNDVLDLARQRGCGSNSGGLRSLRTVSGFLCREGTAEERRETESLVHAVECVCLACVMESLAAS